MVLNAGVYYFNLMDSYGASGMALMIVAVCEVILDFLKNHESYFQSDFTIVILMKI